MSPKYHTIEFYATASLKARGYGCSIRATTNMPNLKRNEVAVKIKLSLPHSLFERPKLEAHLKIDADSVTPHIVEADIIDNIEEYVKTHHGLDMTIEALPLPDSGGDNG